MSYETELSGYLLVIYYLGAGVAFTAWYGFDLGLMTDVLML